MTGEIPAGPGVDARTSSSPMRIQLDVPGKPQQWSRASRGQNGPSFTPSNVVQQMDRLYVAWERDGKRRFPDDTPLMLMAGFFTERGSSHYGSGRNSEILKSEATSGKKREPIGRPDIDNLVKLIGDTLSGHAFDDDARFTLGGQIKAYLPRGTGSFTRIVIRPSNAVWRRLILGELDVDLTEGQA